MNYRSNNKQQKQQQNSNQFCRLFASVTSLRRFE